MIDFEFEFQYAEAKLPILRQVGGGIPAGRCVVLCGGSGCGKSTLLRCINGLIPQFYEGELKGFCRLNGQDTAGLRIGEIGELAASVFQDPRSQFFTVNSSNEVAFGLENHGLPQDKIRRRVDEAFWIFHLERLKDRNVYELSSGERQLISILSAWAMDTDIFLFDEPTANLDFAATQQLKEILLALKRQRISIARAVLKDAPIVILDEATSYTDPENEAVIQSALARLAQGKTLLVIAHRLSTIADADQIIVVNQGKIEATGTQTELLASCPLYQNMWEAHISVKDDGEVA